MSSYRVDELARAAGVSVDTVRYYQARALLPPPRHHGRVAWYSQEHLERLRRVRGLQRQGLSLALIGRLLSGRLGRGDAGLAEAVAEAQSEDSEEFLTVEEVARRSGVPTGLLRTVQRAGLAIGRTVDGEERFTTADLEVVRLGLLMLERGLPVDRLIELGRRYDSASRGLVEEAVDLFDEYVRRPIRTTTGGPDDAAELLVGAFRDLLPAATTVVAHHFRRLLLQVALEHMERVGDEAEVAATRAESRRLHEGPATG